MPHTVVSAVCQASWNPCSHRAWLLSPKVNPNVEQQHLAPNIISSCSSLQLWGSRQGGGLGRAVQQPHNFQSPSPRLTHNCQIVLWAQLPAPFLPRFQMCSFPRKPHCSLSPLIAPFLPAPGLGRFPKSLRIGFQCWRPGWAAGESAFVLSGLWPRGQRCFHSVWCLSQGAFLRLPLLLPSWVDFNSKVRKRLRNQILLLFLTSTLWGCRQAEVGVGEVIGAGGWEPCLIPQAFSPMPHAYPLGTGWGAFQNTQNESPERFIQEILLPGVPLSLQKPTLKRKW